jgi:hypothetical protein
MVSVVSNRDGKRGLVTRERKKWSALVENGAVPYP